MRNEAKRAAQDALFTAIKTSAETNTKAAIKATEKAQILRDLAEAYRLAAGSPASDGASRQQSGSEGSGRRRRSTEESSEDRPRKRAARSGRASAGSD